MLTHAKYIIIIGYAFGDPQVNQEIVGAVKNNHSLRVLVVDPGNESSTTNRPPFSYLEMSDFETDWSQFIWMTAHFGSPETMANLLEDINKFAP